MREEATGLETSEKIVVVRAMAKGAEVLDDDAVAYYLSMAEKAILNRMFPFHPEEELPERLSYTQIRIAVYNINKRGAEGETKHIEVGTERDFASADIPDDLLKELMPTCGVPE